MKFHLFFVTYYYSLLYTASIQKLMQIPTVSSSIEVWDFLSVDSQVGIYCSHILSKCLLVNLHIVWLVLVL